MLFPFRRIIEREMKTLIRGGTDFGLWDTKNGGLDEINLVGHGFDSGQVKIIFIYYLNLQI
jgi:hypothetical protein